jgi:hypothetical protein
MKSKVLIFALLLLSVAVFAKHTDVPKAVKESFAKLYPNASNAKWDHEKKHNFEVEFKDNGIETSVIFDKNGNLVESESTIQNTELPANIEKTINSKYNGYKIVKAEKNIDAKGKVCFELDIKKDKMKKELIFDKDGNFVKED